MTSSSSSSPLVVALCGLFVLAAQAAAATPPANGGPGFAGENWIKVQGFTTTGYRFFMSQNWELFSTKNSTEFVNDVTFILSSYLGLDASRIRLASFGQSTQVLDHGAQDPRALLQLHIDYPTGWDSMPTMPSLLSSKRSAWQLGWGGMESWFPAKWGLKTRFCPEASGPGDATLPSSSLLCDYTDDQLSIEPVPFFSDLTTAPHTTTTTSLPTTHLTTASHLTMASHLATTPAVKPMLAEEEEEVQDVLALNQRIGQEEQPLMAAHGAMGYIYEVFATRMTHSEAVALCASRNGKLAVYEMAFGVGTTVSVVDGLCDAELEMECWVGSMFVSEVKCTAFSEGQLGKSKCAAKLHPVCQRAAQAAAAATAAQ